jgi:predicted DNA-binding transcriptional regulator YafY
MRADRLVSLLILLQTRGRMTARKLAEELEVSERTIYRDIEALSEAGVPVYAERGPGGGCALLESYRTNLTGLNDEETRALFMLSTPASIPAPLVELGVSQELKSALLKLSAALPASQRQEEERARQRVHLDSVAWSRSEEPVPHLAMIHKAVWRDLRLLITFQVAFWHPGVRPVDLTGWLLRPTPGTWLRRGDAVKVYRIHILEALPDGGAV